MKTNDVASVVLFVNWLECFREIWAGLETKETLLLVVQESCCKIIWDSEADPGFQVRGGALKKNAPSGGRRETFWGISCEKSRFYAKKSDFFQWRREARKLLGYFVWKITILRQKIIWIWPFTLKGAMSRFFAVEMFFSDATEIIFSYFPAKCQSN